MYKKLLKVYRKMATEVETAGLNLDNLGLDDPLSSENTGKNCRFLRRNGILITFELFLMI